MMSTRGLLLVCLIVQQLSAAASDKPTFNRDIRPILATKCFACHGRDEETREAELRLDQRQFATRERDGYRAIVPGNPDESEVWRRIVSTDEDVLMPPPDRKHPLTEQEKNIIREWIAAGAE